MLFAPPATRVTRGTGEATALIHGALSSPAFWHKPLPHRVLAGRTMSYPLPGHFPWVLNDGMLGRLLTPRALADAYASALRRDFLGQPVHLIGHSTGGFVALLVAMRHPALVKRLTLAGSFADARVAGGSPMIKSLLTGGGYGAFAVQTLISTWLSSRTLFDAGLRSVLGGVDDPWKNPLFAKHSELVRADLRRSDLNQLVTVGQWVANQRIHTHLGQIKQPTLVLAGDVDPIVPFNHQRQIAHALPHARFAPFTRTGHLPMAEQGRAFCITVDGFLGG